MHDKTPTTDEKLTHFWSVQLPKWLDPWTPMLGDALSDGSWTAVWRRVSGYAPLAALAVGFLTPWLWPGVDNVYSESLPFMMLVVAGAILSGPLGVMLLLGYVLGVLVGGTQARYDFFDYPVRRSGSLLLSHMLLAIPAVLLPQLGRRMAEQVRLPGSLNPVVHIGVRVVLYAAACAMLVYLWCHAMIALIRPVFTWLWDYPTLEAIEQVQDRWQWLAGAAAAGAAARIMLERVVTPYLARAEVARHFQEERWSEPQRRGERWRRLPLAVRIGLGSAGTTLLLAGLYTSWIDAPLVAGVTAALGVWRAGLIASLPPAWARVVLGVPAMVRFAAATLLGYLLARVVVEPSWDTMRATDSFRPMLIGALLTLVTFYLLFPNQPSLRGLRRASVKGAK